MLLVYLGACGGPGSLSGPFPREFTDRLWALVSTQRFRLLCVLRFDREVGRLCLCHEQSFIFVIVMIRGIQECWMASRSCRLGLLSERKGRANHLQREPRAIYPCPNAFKTHHLSQTGADQSPGLIKSYRKTVKKLLGSTNLSQM
jgi:hypothetical protein